MQIPVKTNFHNIDPSDALKARIDEKISKLDARFPNLLGCHVVVEAAHHHQHQGRLYSVRIVVTLPGGEAIVSHHPGRNPRKHDKVFAAMNNAFAAINRQLTRLKDVQKAAIKTHTMHFEPGVVSNFFLDDGYGFIATADGTEVYFHQHAVENQAFTDLDIGSRVRFVLASGEGRKGPQASFVRLSP